MRILIFFLFFLHILAITGCFSDTTGDDESKNPVVDNNCEDIPQLKWKIYSRGFTSEEALELATQLTVAAKADSKKLQTIIDASANADVGITSELAKIVNLSVKQDSTVSDGFWKQELTYRRSVCLLNDMLKRDDFTETQRDKILDDILAFNKAARDYVFVVEVKKKENAMILK